MKRKMLRFGKGFRLALQNDFGQAAEMVLPPGKTEGGPDNFHKGSDQWLFVVEGEGIAIVNTHRYPLKAGILMVIERGTDTRFGPPAKPLSERSTSTFLQRIEARTRHSPLASHQNEFGSR